LEKAELLIVSNYMGKAVASTGKEEILVADSFEYGKDTLYSTEHWDVSSDSTFRYFHICNRLQQ